MWLSVDDERMRLNLGELIMKSGSVSEVVAATSSNHQSFGIQFLRIQRFTHFTTISGYSDCTYSPLYHLDSTSSLQSIPLESDLKLV